MDAPPSFEFAKEIATQLLTLATGVIGVTATFAKDISPSVTKGRRKWLYRSWIVFLLSIPCGFWALDALTGTLANEPVTAHSIYTTSIQTPFIAQEVLFFIGIVLLIVDAAYSSNQKNRSSA